MIYRYLKINNANIKLFSSLSLRVSFILKGTPCLAFYPIFTIYIIDYYIVIIVLKMGFKLDCDFLF